MSDGRSSREQNPLAGDRKQKSSAERSSDSVDLDREEPLPFYFAGMLLGGGAVATLFVVLLLWFTLDRTALGQPSEPPKLSIEVTAREWWWEIRYLDDEPHRIFETANEIRVPAGEAVRLILKSGDVIHSLWVPAIAGKTDLIPGRINETVIEATKPGVYRGQCAEFCGLQHAHMALTLVVEEPEAFEAWREAQLQPAAEPPSETTAQGQAIFAERCGFCHAVRGTQALGEAGPDLTHLQSRHTLAAGTLPNTRGHLAGWIADPQGVKPGSKMPTLNLSAPELHKVVAYLETLE